MSGNWRYWVVLVLALAAASVSGSSDSGYLPVVGPSALRFRAPFVAHATNVTMLPPPAISTPEPVLLKPETLDPLNGATNATPAAAEEPPPASPPTSVAPESPTTDQIISPQMFLKFFNKGTNGSGAGIIGPMNFTPPTSSQPPSSKATFSISPP